MNIQAEKKMYFLREKETVPWPRDLRLSDSSALSPSLSTAPRQCFLYCPCMIEPHRVDSQTSVSLELKSSKTESPPCPFGSLNFGYT